MKYLAYFLGGFRCIIGLTLLVLPHLGLPGWIHAFSSENEVAIFLAQHMGIRDAVIGLGFIFGVWSQSTHWRLWLLAAMLCDLTDGLLVLLHPDLFEPNDVLSNLMASTVLLLLEGWVLVKLKVR